MCRVCVRVLGCLEAARWCQLGSLTLAEGLAGAGQPARGTTEGSLEAVVLLGQLLDGLLQVDALLLLILQRPLPFPAVSLS